MLLFISQAMKADQACIVIFREKTAFRRYMICLFHVLDRLGSLILPCYLSFHFRLTLSFNYILLFSLILFQRKKV